MDKTNLILNSTIELVDTQEEGNGKGRYFMSRFIEPGIAHYEELGDILITKETLSKFIQTMVGAPVIIDHEDVTDANADKLRVGVVSRVWFNEADGYFYCEGILTDPEAIDLVKNQGWNVSCAYSFQSVPKDMHNGKKIDMEFIDGEFLHLAIVKNPRYEGANIVVNKNDEVENARNFTGEEGDWITVHGVHIFIPKGKDVKEVLEEKFEKKEEKRQKRELTEEDKKSLGLEEKNVEPVQPASPTPKYPDKQRKEQEPNKKDKQGDSEFERILKEKKKEKQIEDGITEIKDEYGRTTFKKGNKWANFSSNGGRQDSWIASYGLTHQSGVSWEREKGITEEQVLSSKSFKTEKGARKWALEQIKRLTANNSIGDITMQVLNELKEFIKSVVSNEKEEEMKEVKNEDKRKLIDEVGGILKGKVDEELWRTVVGKLEKIAYEPSEDDKADNEDDKEKEAKNKCKNEEDEEAKEDVTKNEDKPEDDGEDKEEDKPEDKAENKKVKNSMRDMVMGGSSNVQEQKLYISRKERLEEGNKY